MNQTLRIYVAAICALCIALGGCRGKEKDTARSQESSRQVSAPFHQTIPQRIAPIQPLPQKIQPLQPLPRRIEPIQPLPQKIQPLQPLPRRIEPIRQPLILYPVPQIISAQDTAEETKDEPRRRKRRKKK